MNFNSRLLLILFFLLSLIIIQSNCVYGQKQKIIKVLDSNLFELYDGTLIKIACLDVPNINHPDPILRKIGIEAYDYAKRTLLKRSYEFIYPQLSQIDSNYKLVFLIKEYPLGDRDYTIKYLEKGYGKFISNVDYPENEKFLEAENYAKKNQNGIWEFEIINGTLDQNYDGAPLLTEEAADSIYSTSFMGSFFKNVSNQERIILELVAAPLIGIPSAFLSGMAVAGLSNSSGHGGWENFDLIIASVFLGYSFGNALGVYAIAKNGEKEVTLGETFLASSFGGVLSIALLMSSSDEFIGNQYQGILALSLPAISAIIYANIFADDKPVYDIQYSTKSNALHNSKKWITHEDFYNSRKIFDLEVVKIIF